MAFQPSAQTSLDRLARQSATPRTLERFDSTPAFCPLQLSSWPRPQPQKTTTRSSFRRLLRRRLASTRAKLQTMVRNDHWSFDPDLEGVRSLGAALDDRGFVLVATRAWAQCWVFIGSAA